MRAIIISDSREDLAYLRHMLAKLVPDIEVTEHDPEQMGQPSPGFDWSFYDLLLIKDRLQGTESGLAWVAVFSLSARLPATVLLADSIDDFIAAKVDEMDRTEYLLRDELSLETLSAVLDKLEVGASKPASSRTLANLAIENDSEIVRRLAGDGGDDANGYKFVRMIGQGAQSRVYLAERIADQQTMVLKVLDLDAIDDESAVQRFAREAELIAKVDSPYVIKFYDHGFTPSYGYIAVEFFARGDLKQRIENGIETGDALLYALNIAYGLEAIHGLGIVHRDLKPGNIMFRADESIALADFGISKHMNDSWNLTKTGAVIGTLSYLSPEQGLGKKIDHRADLYALGMVLFEMLTGKKAFHATSPGALVYQHLYADVPLLPDHLTRYQRIIAKTLAKDPEDRYQNAAELIEQLLPLCA
ncbi:MAG: serine/threonine-protein kinase [Gammaproteobacteria bacterium]